MLATGGSVCEAIRVDLLLLFDVALEGEERAGRPYYLSECCFCS